MVGFVTPPDVSSSFIGVSNSVRSVVGPATLPAYEPERQSLA
jgi:hypothetical protein